MRSVLFVCVHNSGRSQMAEALLNHYAQGKAQAISAGTQPGTQVNPVAVQAMRELGLDISEKRPKLLTDEMIAAADRIITMGCAVDAEACPAIFFKAVEDWGLEDPYDKPIEQVRLIRDEIAGRVRELLAEF